MRSECKNYPCSDWEELMESLLATSIYKLMPNDIRPKMKKTRRGGAAGARKYSAAVRATNFDSDGR